MVYDLTNRDNIATLIDSDLQHAHELQKAQVGLFQGVPKLYMTRDIERVGAEVEVDLGGLLLEVARQGKHQSVMVSRIFARPLIDPETDRVVTVPVVTVVTRFRS